MASSTVRLSCAYLPRKAETKQLNIRQKMATCSSNTSLCKNTGRARQQSPGAAQLVGKAASAPAQGDCCANSLQETGSQMTSHSPVDSLQQKFPSRQCHHTVTEVPCVGLECDANPTQVKTADHTTKSTASARKAGRSALSRCIKQVYVPQGNRKEHLFCL